VCWCDGQAAVNRSRGRNTRGVDVGNLLGEDGLWLLACSVSRSRRAAYRIHAPTGWPAAHFGTLSDRLAADCAASATGNDVHGIHSPSGDAAPYVSAACRRYSAQHRPCCRWARPCWCRLPGTWHAAACSSGRGRALFTGRA
jgi:hypothetical protein